MSQRIAAAEIPIIARIAASLFIVGTTRSRFSRDCRGILDSLQLVDIVHQHIIALALDSFRTIHTVASSGVIGEPGKALRHMGLIIRCRFRVIFLGEIAISRFGDTDRRYTCPIDPGTGNIRLIINGYIRRCDLAGICIIKVNLGYLVTAAANGTFNFCSIASI